jgi:hypothetical protein
MSSSVRHDRIDKRGNEEVDMDHERFLWFLVVSYRLLTWVLKDALYNCLRTGDNILCAVVCHVGSILV